MFKIVGFFTTLASIFQKSFFISVQEEMDSREREVNFGRNESRNKDWKQSKKGSYVEYVGGELVLGSKTKPKTEKVNKWGVSR